MVTTQKVLQRHFNVDQMKIWVEGKTLEAGGNINMLVGVLSPLIAPDEFIVVVA